MKAILVVDLDQHENIDIEGTKATYIELETKNEIRKISLIGHWLKPLPQRKIVGKIKEVDDFMKSDIQVINEKVIAEMRLDTELLIASGYNLCIDEILGE